MFLVNTLLVACVLAVSTCVWPPAAAAPRPSAGPAGPQLVGGALTAPGAARLCDGCTGRRPR
jgi:hypothetical protein